MDMHESTRALRLLSTMGLSNREPESSSRGLFLKIVLDTYDMLSYCKLNIEDCQSETTTIRFPSSRFRRSPMCSSSET
jgi:hypothetical protein